VSQTTRLLRILYLEDDALDSELVQATLAAGDITCEITRVEVREEFATALEEGEFDLLLSDYSLPSSDDRSPQERCDRLRAQAALGAARPGGPTGTSRGRATD
jgi:CheY-like chemotaxis protein